MKNNYWIFLLFCLFASCSKETKETEPSSEVIMNQETGTDSISIQDTLTRSAEIVESRQETNDKPAVADFDPYVLFERISPPSVTLQERIAKEDSIFFESKNDTLRFVKYSEKQGSYPQNKKLGLYYANGQYWAKHGYPAKFYPLDTDSLFQADSLVLIDSNYMFYIFSLDTDSANATFAIAGEKGGLIDQTALRPYPFSSNPMFYTVEEGNDSTQVSIYFFDSRTGDISTLGERKLPGKITGHLSGANTLYFSTVSFDDEHSAPVYWRVKIVKEAPFEFKPVELNDYKVSFTSVNFDQYLTHFLKRPLDEGNQTKKMITEQEEILAKCKQVRKKDSCLIVSGIKTYCDYYKQHKHWVDQREHYLISWYPEQNQLLVGIADEGDWIEVIDLENKESFLVENIPLYSTDLNFFLELSSAGDGPVTQSVFALYTFKNGKTEQLIDLEVAALGYHPSSEFKFHATDSSLALKEVYTFKGKMNDNRFNIQFNGDRVQVKSMPGAFWLNDTTAYFLTAPMIPDHVNPTAVEYFKMEIHRKN